MITKRLVEYAAIMKQQKTRMTPVARSFWQMHAIETVPEF